MIYFVQSGENGPIKIGYCRGDRSVQSRIGSMQTGNPELLKLRAVIPGAAMGLERALHRAFQTAHIRGEWFEPTDALLKVIDVVLAGDTNTDALLKMLQRPVKAQRVWTKLERAKRLQAQIDSGEVTVKQMPANS